MKNYAENIQSSKRYDNFQNYKYYDLSISCSTVTCKNYSDVDIFLKLSLCILGF